MKDDTSHYIASLTAALFGAGVLGRSALGLRRMMTPQPSVSQVQPRYSIGGEPEEEEATKMAADTPPRTPPYGFGWIKDVLNRIQETPPNAPNALVGDDARSMWGNPVTMGVGLPLAAGGLYGGYKLTDMLLDARRKNEQDEEVEAARQQYADLINDQSGFRPKIAADAFDELAEETCQRLEKNAEGEEPTLANEAMRYTPGPVKDLAGAGVGGWGAYALLAALASGKLSYDYFNSRGQKAVAEEALRRRQLSRNGGMLPMQIAYSEGANA